MLVAERHVFSCRIEKSFTLEHGALLNNCTYVIIIDFTLWELQSADATLANDFLIILKVFVGLLFF